MDYLRDGKVTLPITETKEAFVAELKYFNIAVNVDIIDDRKIAGAAATSSLRYAVKSLKEKTTHGAIQNHCAEIAMFCFNGFFKRQDFIQMPLEY